MIGAMAHAGAGGTFSQGLGASALFVLGVACAALLFALERSVVPSELPPLVLPEGPVRAVVAADAQTARNAPKGVQADALRALYVEQGEAEARGTEDAGSYFERRKALETGYRALSRKLGAAAMLALRAQAVEELEAALALQLPEARAKATLGAMTRVLEREGATRDGYIVAPMFVVRTLHKARWNILHGLDPDQDFEHVEKRAFYGWQALCSEHVSLRRRVEALHGYAKAGGDHVEEALGVLLYRLGDYAQAARALQDAYHAHPNLRLRNYALAARAAASAAN
jgi:hypothetical protein